MARARAAPGEARAAHPRCAAPRRARHAPMRTRARSAAARALGELLLARRACRAGLRGDEVAAQGLDSCEVVRGLAGLALRVRRADVGEDGRLDVHLLRALAVHREHHVLRGRHRACARAGAGAARVRTAHCAGAAASRHATAARGKDATRRRGLGALPNAAHQRSDTQAAAASPQERARTAGSPLGVQGVRCNSRGQRPCLLEARSRGAIAA